MAGIVSSNSVSGPVSGVGLGWRRELAGDLLAHSNREAVDFVELIAESCYAPGPLRREALAISSIWKVIPHGIKLSLGSADGVDMERARRFGELARAVRAPVVSEHVAFTRGPGRDREIGHLTQLPLTRVAVAVVARNLAKVRRVLPDVPFLLETPAWTLRWPEDEMDEGSFFHEIVRATGCDLLLDLSNVYANAQNSGRAPLELLRSYPLSRVAMVHLAGGDWRDGFYVDTHAHPTPAAAFELLAELLRVAGPVPVLIERDGNYPPFSELRGELDRARAMLAGAPGQPRPAALKVGECSAAESELTALARRQGQLTALLTGATPPDASQCAPFEPAAILRSRNILHHKRAEEALAILPRLSRCAGSDPGLYQLALACVKEAGRAPAFTAAADALRIAEAAAARPALADAARAELLQLRARFTGSRLTPRARWAPFVGSVSHPDGRRTWAFKPPGRFAPVRFRTSASASENSANSANLEIERPT